MGGGRRAEGCRRWAVGCRSEWQRIPAHRLRSTVHRLPPFPLRPRVGCVVYPGKVLEIKVRVDLGRADVGVPEQFLDRAQVARGFEQVRGERVTEHVRVDVLGQPLPSRPLGDPPLHDARAEPPAVHANEDGQLADVRRWSRAPRASVTAPRRLAVRPARCAPCGPCPSPARRGHAGRDRPGRGRAAPRGADPRSRGVP